MGDQMKKLVGLLFAFLAIFLALQTTTDVKADKFTVKNYDVTVDIKKDGNADLTQKIVYDFQGDYHGVYYNQDLKGIKGASDPVVTYNNGAGAKTLVNNDSNQNDTVKVTRTDNSMDMKVYHAVDSEMVTYTYKYQLYGVITNYLDTAELNWKIIGNGWDNDLNNIKLTLNFPEKNITQLQAWTHGPLAGHTEVDKKNGQVVMTLDELPANQSVESHVIFPTTVTADNKNVVNKKAKARILAAEKSKAEAANARRQREKNFYWIMMAIAGVVIVIIYLYQFIKLHKNPGQKHQIPTPLHHFFDEPEFIPSFTEVILDRQSKANSNSLTADLLNEVGYRRMKIDKIGKDYQITALVPPTNEFFKYLIEKIGDGKSVCLKDIRKFARGNDDKMTKKFDKWAKDAAKGREKYLDLSNMNLVDSFKSSTIAVDIVLGIMLMISLILSSKVLLSSAILVVIGLVAWIPYAIIKKKITPYTDLGEEEVNKIRAFKRMLEDIDDIKMAEVGDIILWERFLPYAVIFGVSDKVIKALKVNFGADVVNNSAIAYYYIGSSSFLNSNTGFQTAFTGAISAGGSSSISGGSGGFSGGSSGGFGGGSGGGAF
ncbi:integral membrane protein [Companilactobacillus paralimentarius DSM 13238 = JCM 10415]|uniref:Integral membrane protein n=3 Tax=Companilactobacillus paralimentarius TaxID=83526 RepID=A0A0R1PPH3_9LACO|nr:integral membrane protein [Companilactobacillus paralimentarius DSM 13238 = JCM 10415]